MKKKPLSFQQQEINKMLQKEVCPAVVNYGLPLADIDLAENLADEMSIPFCKIEAILSAYHTARLKSSNLLDKEVVKIIDQALVPLPKPELLKGLFQSTAMSA